MTREVTIVGGGVAGLACAITLLRTGHEVTVIDASDEDALSTKDNSLGDINVFMMDGQCRKLVEDLLHLEFDVSKYAACLAGSGLHALPSDRFLMAEKGCSPCSVNTRMRHVAEQLGAVFQRRRVGSTDALQRENAVLAMGARSDKTAHRLFGWRFELDSDLPEKGILIDVSSITDSYCYTAKLNGRTTAILLAKKRMSDGAVEEYYNSRLRKAIGSSSPCAFRPFAFSVPVRLRNPYRQKIIGTMRGLNDSLFYFGFADSIVDGINFGLSRSVAGFTGRSFLSSCRRRHVALGAANWVKELFRRMGRKELFAEIILDRPYLIDCFVAMSMTSLPSDLEMEMRSLLSCDAQSQRTGPSDAVHRKASSATPGGWQGPFPHSVQVLTKTSFAKCAAEEAVGGGERQPPGLRRTN